MNKTIPLLFFIFLFSGCIPENKKISLTDGVYIGNYPNCSPLFVFTSWGEGYIVPEDVIQINCNLDSLIKNENNSLFYFETNKNLVDSRFSLLSFDGKYATATFDGDFRQSSYCYLSNRSCNNDDFDNSNFVLEGVVYDYPTIGEQINALFNHRLFKKDVSPDWKEFYHTHVSGVDKEAFFAEHKLKLIYRRPIRTRFTNYATISIEEPVIFVNPLFPNERLVFDKSILEFYKDDIFFDYKKNTYSYVLKGFNGMGNGHIFFEGSGGALVSYQPHVEYYLKPVTYEMTKSALSYVEPINRNCRDTVANAQELFVSLVSTLDEYFQSIDPLLLKNLEKERNHYRVRGILYE